MDTGTVYLIIHLEIETADFNHLSFIIIKQKPFVFMHFVIVATVSNRT